MNYLPQNIFNSEFIFTFTLLLCIFKLFFNILDSVFELKFHY